ncbi:MAG TPA: MBL fold metallo-hydrolase, partial [Herpetosiphonaceae bacterium]|nr:MBL fold metallo-hydrolase [Herpetosiphonaceae bacterium]
MPNGISSLELRTRDVGPWPMHTYAFVCAATRRSVLIDPGADPAALLEMLDGTKPEAILLTHTHADHVGALAEMRSRLRVPLMAHRGPHVDDLMLDTDRVLADGDVVEVGQGTLRVYATPGHTADMLCFADESSGQIVVGDTLFAGGPGRTWSAGHFQTLLRTLREVVLRWPDDVIC